MTRQIEHEANVTKDVRVNAVEPFWKTAHAPDEEKRPGLRKPVTSAAIAVLLGFGGFLVWGFTANLDSAAIARGKVIADSKTKPISHLEGGILKRLLVQEGDFVKAGQPLIELDATRARAELQQLRGKRISLLATLARLRAERDRKDTVEMPAELAEINSPMVEDVMEAERRLFQKRREVYEGKLKFQRKEIEQHTAQIEAAEAQIAANADRRILLEERVAALSSLEKKGFTSKAQLSEVQLALSELIGDGGELAAEKARSEKARQGAEVALLSTEQELQSEIAGKLLEAQLELNITNEKIISARDVLDRLVINSPQDGIVYNIQMRTPGGVIEPGKPILEIVPNDEKMVIEVRMDTDDINAVHVGSEARIRLTAYERRRTSPLEGKVTYVAADQSLDPQTQYAYYVVRAIVNERALEENPEVSLSPGMPAEVLIIRRARKAMEYLLEPITDSFNRAFREE